MSLTFEDFVNSPQRNAWVKEKSGLELYVRRSLPNRKTDFDIANMNNERRGNGSLKDFLDKWEPKFSFYIENVVNKELEEFFKKRGYKPIEPVYVGSRCLSNFKK